MNPTQPRLGDLLLQEGLLTPAKLQHALAIQKEEGFARKIGTILIDEGFITEEQRLQAIAKQSHYPIVDLFAYTIDPALIARFPYRLLLSAHLLPLEETPDTLLFATSDPINNPAMETVERMSGTKRVIWNLAKQQDILDVFHRFDISRSIQTLLRDVKREIQEVGLREDNDESAAMRLVRLFFRDAILRNASDIHVEPDADSARVRVRVDGILREAFVFDLDVYQAVASLIKIMGALDISEKRRPQDGRFELMLDGRHYDFRLSAIPTMYGESLVMRILEQEKVLLSIQDLGFPKGTTRLFEAAIRQPYGFILVTGPTGSGKTTTLYAALNDIKSLENKVVTLEDPVEYRLPLVQQVQIHEKIGVTFATALRSFLRQDPDVIMVGEIRDRETLEIATQAAMTGHLLFSTLHSNDAVSTINRMTQMGLPPYLIADSLLLILSQRLVRRICPHCRREVKPQDAAVARLKPWLPEHPHFYAGAGCSKCENSGYMGRTVISEVLHIDRTISRMIGEGASKQAIEETALSRKQLSPFILDGVRKVLSGITTLDELLRVIRSA